MIFRIVLKNCPRDSWIIDHQGHIRLSFPILSLFILFFYYGEGSKEKRQWIGPNKKYYDPKV
jgi:hypothetical protein